MRFRGPRRRILSPRAESHPVSSRPRHIIGPGRQMRVVGSCNSQLIFDLHAGFFWTGAHCSWAMWKGPPSHLCGQDLPPPGLHIILPVYMQEHENTSPKPFTMLTGQALFLHQQYLLTQHTRAPERSHLGLSCLPSGPRASFQKPPLTPRQTPASNGPSPTKSLLVGLGPRCRREARDPGSIDK